MLFDLVSAPDQVRRRASAIASTLALPSLQCVPARNLKGREHGAARQLGRLPKTDVVDASILCWPITQPSAPWSSTLSLHRSHPRTSHMTGVTLLTVRG